MSDQSAPFHIALVSGAIAGMSVDASLFPIDTIKTRLQSSQGFLKAGGFRGIYSGILPAFVGSAPTAAIFFSTYEGAKSAGSKLFPRCHDSFIHMGAASAGEVMACLVRVPVEVVKQRAQATRQWSVGILRRTVAEEGIKGLYRGYSVTVMREIPFSLVQFPLWEMAKKSWGAYQGRPTDAWQGAVCGSLAGGVAAAVTTPLDVVKTRIMLASKGSNVAVGNVLLVAREVLREKGLKGLFAGVTPRVTFIAIGGFIFLGMYEKSKVLMLQTL
ncbi:mitochondrial S-adenosylmethionine carrier protein-like [Diadema antillarum]|uniref:mitochondrial S-adenosylmethionine carrier protein-like n=1 Tax=Diadema antillarum TaxID=105358 RepID=UPI003A89FD99